jgi:hypothetical protein
MAATAAVNDRWFIADGRGAPTKVLPPAADHARGSRVGCTYVLIDKPLLHAKQIALDFFDQDR